MTMEKISKRCRPKFTAFLLGMLTILLIGGCLTMLGIYLAGNQTNLFIELQHAKIPLLLWRITLYSLVAAMWFHRVRRALLRQVTTPIPIYRLEIMMVCLGLLIEFTSYRWGM